MCSKFTIGDECWEWNGASGRGYGLISDGSGRLRPAHRMMYELLVGPVPEGLDLDHLCRNRGCINPKHLEPVTHKVNINRGRKANAEKTHCKNGHPFNDENTRRSVRKNGRQRRDCLSCERSKNVGPKPLPTHCKNGHEYMPENIYMTTDNARACRICRQQWMRDFYARKKALT